jgi:hypothetical protein
MPHGGFQTAYRRNETPRGHSGAFLNVGRNRARGRPGSQPFLPVCQPRLTLPGTTAGPETPDANTQEPVSLPPSRGGLIRAPS